MDLEDLDSRRTAVVTGAGSGTGRATTELAVNVTGLMLSLRAFAPRLRPGSSVVTFASVAALSGVPRRDACTASKGAVVAPPTGARRRHRCRRDRTQVGHPATASWRAVVPEPSSARDSEEKT